LITSSRFRFPFYSIFVIKPPLKQKKAALSFIAFRDI
jgi:hypothetical protein